MVDLRIVRPRFGEEQVLQRYNAPLASVLIVTKDPRAAALEQLPDSTISRWPIAITRY